MKQIIGIIILAGLLASCGDISYKANVRTSPGGTMWTSSINGKEIGPCYSDTSLTCPESGCITAMGHERSCGVSLMVWKVRDGGLNGFFLGEEEFLGQDTAADSGSVAEVCW